MKSSSGLLTTLPSFVNAHLHSPNPHFKGVTRTQPFEIWLADRDARHSGPLTPAQLRASAIVTGLENLASGNGALIDHVIGYQTKEHIYAIAEVYEALGIRAWVFVEACDLPRLCYTKEAYPGYSKAIPTAELPEDMQQAVQPPLHYEDQLRAVAQVIRGWEGRNVKLGLALSNPVWCTDDLLGSASDLAKDLGVPLETHAEESPIQREVSLAQWGMSGIQRLAHFGLLSQRTIIAHAVQVDDADIGLLAKYGASVSHNPVSNLKLQNGIAPIGKMLSAGVNVCLGTDAQACADSQSLFPMLKFVVALAGLNGLRELGGITEEIALSLAVDNGRKLWFDDDIAHDYMQFSRPVGPYAYVWDSPEPLISEVFVSGRPVLANARQLAGASGAEAVTAELMAQAVAPEKLARAERWASKIASYNTAR